MQIKIKREPKVQAAGRTAGGQKKGQKGKRNKEMKSKKATRKILHTNPTNNMSGLAMQKKVNDE